MKKFLRFNSAKSSQDRGFITLEILVAILVASTFLAVAMQSLVFAMALKIQAQERQRASQLISEDLEMANELANRSNIAGNCDAAIYNNGFGNGLWVALNAGGPPTKGLLSDADTRQLALQRTHVSATAGNSNAPHRALRVRYQVWWGWDGTNFLDSNNAAITNADEPIAETYVEIIPDVALACP